MTSTNINVGLCDNKRNSRQVMNPPGGAHSDIFGAVESPVHKAVHKPTAISQIFGAEKVAGITTAHKRGNQSSISFGDEDHENKNPSKQPGTENNGAGGEQPPPQIADIIPKGPIEKPKRVPPGGFSQGLW